MPLPARALGSRLRAASDTPSWASFLPPQLLLQCPTRAVASGTSSTLPVGSALRADAPAFQCPGGSGNLRASALPFEVGASGGAFAGSESIARQPQREAPAKHQWLDVWKLSQDVNGCRVVQQAFEEGSNDERLQLVEQLRGHVWEALRCPHANHVIQKCITTTRPRDSHFIISELCQNGSGAAAAARHRYGCRILERLLEHLAEQAQPLVDLIIAEGIELSKHVFGNYIMQHILEHGTLAQKHRLCRMLAPVAHTLGLDPYACAVIGKALSHGSPQDRVCIAQALLRVPDLLTTIACTRHGHITAKLVLQVSEGKQLAEARGELAKNVQLLRTSRYGRVVIACLDPPRGSQRAGGA